MPKPSPNNKYYQNNPTTSMRFTDPKTSVRTYTNQSGKEHKITWIRPEDGSGYEILPDEILGSGNLAVLQSFQKNNAELLNQKEYANAKRYLEARIQTAEKIAEMEKKAQEDVSLGKRPPLPQPDDKDGFVGFSSLQYSGPQTSYNGCWSCAYSLLLKSRGVDLKQEEIRAWRPDFPEGTKFPNPDNLSQMSEEEGKTKQAPDYAYIKRMNSDNGNSIFANSDLTAKLLPNTSVNQLHINQFNYEYWKGSMTIHGEAPSDEQIKLVLDEYYNQAKERIRQTIYDALQIHASPVAASWDGHYVTITGIREDGTLRIQDSLKEDNSQERTITLDDLTKQALLPHTKGNARDVTFEPTGLELEWLSELPTPEYGSKERPELSAEDRDYVKVDEQGGVTVNVPNDAVGVSGTGRPADGQTQVVGTTRNFVLDDTKLQGKLGGKIESWGPNNGFPLGSTARHYPKKMVRLNDPELMRPKLKPCATSAGKAASLLEIHGVSFNDEEQKRKEDLNNFLAPYRTALETLETVGSDFKDQAKQAEIKAPEAIKTLRGLTDALLHHLPNCEFTNLELLEQAHGKEDAKKLTDTLDKLSKKLNLGFDSKELLEGVERDKKKGRSAEWQQKLRNIWRQGIDALNESGPGAREKRQKCVARLVAADNLWRREKESGVPFPNPSDEEIEKTADAIMGSPAFDEMTAGFLTTVFIDRNRYNNDAIQTFSDELAKKSKKMEEETERVRRYAIPEKLLEAKQKRMSILAKKMDKTKNGVLLDFGFMGAGAIPRWWNSTAFEKAKAAIRNLSVKKNPTALDVLKSVETVKAYLKGKESVRKTDYGIMRWNICMRFLYTAMPADDFLQYCNEVNRIRGVGPNDRGYIGPESFMYGRKDTVESVIDDSIQHIEDGEGSVRDYARILAARDCGKDDSDFIPESTMGNSFWRRELLRSTEKILSDPRFKSFIESKKPDELEEMLKDNAEGLESAWDEVVNTKSKSEQKSEQKGKQPDSQTTKNAGRPVMK